jgi:BolA protein
MGVADIITAKLREAFSPDQLEVIDVSEQHRGHGGWREGGETHFHVVMTSAAFSGESRLEAQRAVNKVLAEELSGPVHALTMDLRGAGD